MILRAVLVLFVLIMVFVLLRRGRK